MGDTADHRYCARYFFEPSDFFDVNLDGDTPAQAHVSKEAYDNAARAFHARTVFHNGVTQRTVFVNFKLIRYSELVENPRYRATDHGLIDDVPEQIVDIEPERGVLSSNFI